ncbi:MAG TPA: DUF393 domain-containing protein [Chlamydiales bacterium]|nr:DUF393 domain-containing protein [Chlamydiales bacterium]
MNEHVVFFDDECPLCHKAVRHIIEIDEKKQFRFAPLRGQTAQTILTGPQKELLKLNSIIVAENYESTARRFWVRSHAILRIYWLIGNGWRLLGIFFFLPNWMGDLLYNWVLAHRHQFKLKIPDQIGPEERFLP